MGFKQGSKGFNSFVGFSRILVSSSFSLWGIGETTENDYIGSEKDSSSTSNSFKVPSSCLLIEDDSHILSIVNPNPGGMLGYTIVSKG